MFHQVCSYTGLLVLASSLALHAQTGPGNAIRFDGADDFVEIPSSPLLNRSAFTAMAWIKPDTLLSNQVLISKMNAGGTNGWALVQEGAYVRGEVWFATAGGNVSIKLTTSPALVSGQWHHVAFSVNTNRLDLMVDALPGASATLPASHTPAYSNTTVMRLGSLATPTGLASGPYRGEMDQLLLLARPMAAKDVIPYLHDHPAYSDTNLLAWFAFDEGNGVTATSELTAGTLSGGLKNGTAWVVPSSAPIGPARVETLPVTKVGPGTAILHGQYDARGRGSSFWFEWGTNSSLGNFTETDSAYNLNMLMPASVTLSNLLAGQTYVYRLALTNSLGVFYGMKVTFTTSMQAAQINNSAAIVTNATSALLTAEVLPNAASGAYWFEWGSSGLTQTSAPVAFAAQSGVILAQHLVPNLVKLSNYSFRALVSNAVQVTAGPVIPFTARHFSVSTIISPTNSYGNPALVSLLKPGDFDGDGDCDAIVILDRDEHELWLLLNEGAGAFSWRKAADQFPGFPAELAAGDLDRDGDLDLVEVTNYDELDMSYPNFAYIWWNNKGSFRRHRIAEYVSYVAPDSVEVADFDLDGWPDFVVGGYRSDSFDRPIMPMIWRNHGGGDFQANTASGLPQSEAIGLRVADFNRDGQPDIVARFSAISGYTNSHGHFALKAQRPDIQLEDEYSIVSDLEGDGWPEIIARQYVSNGMQLAAWTPGKNIAVSNLLELKTFFGLLSAVDINADGLQDIFYGYSDETGAALALNLGGGQLLPLMDQGFKVYPHFAGAWADWVPDGRPDLLILDEGTLRLWRNLVQVSNTPPAAPVGLDVKRIGERLEVTWHPAVDPNQSGGLTYRLAYSTNQSVPPRFAPALPRAADFSGTNTILLASNLPPGEIYVAVQAVDAAFDVSQASSPVRIDLPGAPAVHLSYVGAAWGGQAHLTASINPLSSPSYAWFEYGVAPGQLIPVGAASLLNGTQVQNYSQTLSNLTAGTVYYYRSVNSNSLGVTYGPLQAFATAATSPLPGDTNQDGKVDLTELNQVILHYRNLAQ